MTKRAVVLHSGGMDSSTLIYWAMQEGFEVFALSVFYGQRHRRELSSACEVAYKAGVNYKQINLSSLSYFLAGSALTSTDVPVPEGLYDEESMKATVVPNRNMILFSIAGGYADSIDATTIMGAQHAGDHAVYPDCRPDFMYATRYALSLATEGRVFLDAPFVHFDKSRIAGIARSLEVPLELTWSCYKGGDVHCGRCGTCTERIEAIWNAGFRDPTEYEPGTYAATLKLLREAGKLRR